MKVAIRADSGIGIGAGHVGRCLALAEILKREGHDVAFLSRDTAANSNHMIVDRGFPLHRLAAQEPDEDAAECRSLTREADWIVVDHYNLARPWESQVRRPHCRIAVIDDLADRAHDCDVLIDAGSTQHARYAGLLADNAAVLAGPQFAMLRSEFRLARAPARRTAKGLLIFFGGNDGHGYALKTLRALDLVEHRPTPIRVVMTRAMPAREDIISFARTRADIEIHEDVRDMAGLLTTTAFTIGGGGVAMWERCAMGVPGLVIELAENQRAAIATAEAAGAIRRIGTADAVDEIAIADAIRSFPMHGAALDEMRAAGCRLVDGLGVERIVAFMEPLNLRQAGIDDAKLLWDWANDSDVRANAFSTDRIAWETHIKWLGNRLQDRQCRIYIAAQNNADIGQVRIENSGGVAEIDISMDPGSRGRGLAKIVLIRAIEAYRRDFPMTSFEATVRTTNMASRALFESVGFNLVPSSRSDAVRYEFGLNPYSN